MLCTVVPRVLAVRDILFASSSPTRSLGRGQIKTMILTDHWRPTAYLLWRTARLRARARKTWLHAPQLKPQAARGARCKKRARTRTMLLNERVALQNRKLRTDIRKFPLFSTGSSLLSNLKEEYRGSGLWILWNSYYFSNWILLSPQTGTRLLGVFFFLVPWGHTLGSKINRVAGRVLKIPLASVTIDTLIKCSQSFNTIRVKWKKMTFVLPKRTADRFLHRSYANPGF